MEFYKFQCLGNDYVVVEEKENIDYKSMAPKLCNRAIGIGALGLIVISKDYSKFTYYNYNGEIVNRISKGLFEFFEYLKINDIKLKNKVKFMTSFFEIEAMPSDELTSIKVGKPNYKNQMLGINDDIDSFGRLLKIDDMHYTIYSLYLGEIYTIVFVDSFDNYISSNGNLISNNKLFKKKTNVCFVKKLDEYNIKVKVYDYINEYEEFSLMSAAACVAVGKKLEILSNNVDVHYEYGTINVTVDKKENISINGRSTLIYKGELI